LAEEAKPKLKGAQEARWLQRLEDEHNNFRTSLNSSRVAGGPRNDTRPSNRVGVDGGGRATLTKFPSFERDG